jgi:hypothetical protein
VQQGGEFFSYLQFRLLLVQRNENSKTTQPIDENVKPRLMEARQVTGFFEQVGRNTQYIIHPEEILADNFALFVLQEQDVPSPEVIEKLTATLREAKVNHANE